MLVLAAVAAAMYGIYKIVGPNRTSPSATVTTTAEITIPNPSGLEVEIDKVRVEVARITSQRDSLNEELARARSANREGVEQLGTLQKEVGREATVMSPTSVRKTQRQSIISDQGESTPQLKSLPIDGELFEYVWLGSDDVKSVVLQPGHSAIVRISKGVNFTVEPDAGLIVHVVGQGAGRRTTFEEWANSPFPVMRFEISNPNAGRKLCSFVPR